MTGHSHLKFCIFLGPHSVPSLKTHNINISSFILTIDASIPISIVSNKQVINLILFALDFDFQNSDTDCIVAFCLLLIVTFD